MMRRIDARRPVRSVMMRRPVWTYAPGPPPPSPPEIAQISAMRMIEIDMDDDIALPRIEHGIVERIVREHVRGVALLERGLVFLGGVRMLREPAFEHRAIAHRFVILLQHQRPHLRYLRIGEAQRILPYRQLAIDTLLARLLSLRFLRLRCAWRYLCDDESESEEEREKYLHSGGEIRWRMSGCSSPE